MATPTERERVTTSPNDLKTAGSQSFAAQPRDSFLTRGLAAAGIAAVVNLGILGVATLAGASMRVTPPPGSSMQISIMPVLLMSLMPFTVSLLITWLLARHWPRVTSPLAWAGLAFAVVSTASPLLLADDLGARISLALMHLVVGIAWFVAVRRGRA